MLTNNKFSRSGKKKQHWTFLVSTFFVCLVLTVTSPVTFLTGPLPRVQVAALTMTNNEIKNIAQEVLSTEEKPIKLSLWLLPPRNFKDKIQQQIDKLADNKGPTFDPHVTVIGDIECKSEEEVLEVATKLQEGLKGFGKIPCSFSSVPYTSKGVWNQALFLTMEQSAPFMNLCQQSRAILGLDTENWSFGLPVNMPHLSLFYGLDKDIPNKSEVEPVAPFYSSMLALWKTDPATLEGVPNWTEVVTIHMR